MEEKCPCCGSRFYYPATTQPRPQVSIRQCCDCKTIYKVHYKLVCDAIIPIRRG